MTSSNILKKEDIVWGYGEKIEKCPMCGKEQYVTERLFSEGFARPIYVISQKFYRLLVENKLDKNISFCPVVSVST